MVKHPNRKTLGSSPPGEPCCVNEQDTLAPQRIGNAQEASGGAVSKWNVRPQ